MWKSHNGKEYYYIDLTKAKSDQEGVEAVVDAFEKIKNLPDKSVRILLNTKGYKAQLTSLKKIKDLAIKVQPKIERSATVGATGMMHYMFKLYIKYTKSNVLLFKDLNSALEYVTN